MEYQSGVVRPVGSISEGWNIIKDNYWMYVLMMLVTFVILIAASLVLGLINNGITFAISAALGSARPGQMPAELTAVSLLPQIVSLIISFFTNILVLTVWGALFCGIYTALSRTATTGTADFSDLFAGFSKISACAVVGVVMSLIQFVIGIIQLLGFAAVGISAFGLGTLISSDGQINPAAFGGFFAAILAIVGISLVIQLIISALTAFVYPLIAERNLSGGQALLLSVKSGLANIVGLILLLILVFLMMLGGAFLCLIGMLFVAPIVTAAMYAAYLSVFGRTAGNQNYNPPPPPNFGQQPGY